MSKKSVTQTADDILYVTSMVISRNGQDLVTISEHFPLKQLTPDVIASGHVTGGQEERGMLQLTWPHPSQAEVGVYQCDVETLSVTGHGVKFSQTLNIAEAEVSINDLVTKMHQMEIEKENMQLTIADQTKTIADQGKTIHDNEVSVNKTYQELKLADRAMTSEISVVNKSLTSLRDVARVEPNVFFSAVFTSDLISLSVNQVLVFDKIISNEGNAYNHQSGVFTSPMDGFYFFELHVYPHGNTCYLDVQVNGHKVISVNENSSGTGSASGSTIVRLSKNDQVKVVPWTSSYVYGDSDFLSTIFNGRLVSLV